MMSFLDLLKGSAGDTKKPAPQTQQWLVDTGNPMGRFFEAVGTQGAQRTKAADKNVGMQYMNAGMQPPAVPNMMQMLQGINMQQQGGSRGLPVTALLNMLRGG